MAPIVLASRNAHKLREVTRILEPFGLTVEPLPADVALPPEDGLTYSANALPKARTAALALGRPAIGDDSGIESLALGGRPGVRSARFAGPDASDAENLAKLVAEAPAGSVLEYVCALAYVDPGGAERVFIGRCRGRLADGVRGTGGFGYDPVFLPDDLGGGFDGRTMAELSDAEKDAISHRGRALRAFAQWQTGEAG